MYILEHSGEGMASGPLDDNGIGISSGTALPSLVNIIVPYLRDDPDIEDANDLPDVLSLGNTYAFRSRAREALDQVHLDPAIRITDANVKGRSGRFLERYYWLTSQTRHRVIDRRLSKYRVVTGSNVIIEVNRRVLNRIAIPEYDMFWGEDFQWYVTPPLREALVRLRITGCYFEESIVSD